MANKNLTAAKAAKNDEFYTRLEDIEEEIFFYHHYDGQFKDKVVFCNCDDPEWSNFWQFFADDFYYKELGIKKLVSTHYEPSGAPSYKLELWLDENGVYQLKETPLKGNGDFRSEECIEILKEADIIVSNPPFSLFREYIALLTKYNKKFLCIGNMNAITYKEIFPLIKDNKIWTGYSFNRSYCFKSCNKNLLSANRQFVSSKGLNPDEYIKVPGICWFTNLDTKKRHEPLDLRGNEYYKHDWLDGGKLKPDNVKYPKYDNYDAINVDKVMDIPDDYDGVMGVPITFLDKYCPDQFEIVSFRKGEDGKDLVFTREREREFNRTFEFLSELDVNSRDDQEQRRINQWKDYLRTNPDYAGEPIDYFFPIITKGCVEPYLKLDDAIKSGKPSLPSRQVKYNGHICQKTYHRILIRRKK